MTYTNTHLKESYKFYRISFIISLICLVIGSFILAFGFIMARKQLDNIRPVNTVMQEESNPANKTVYIDIIKVPEKISQDKYEDYYLVTTVNSTYISGMQKEQFEVLKKEVIENGTARLEGFTKVIIDEHVKDIVKEHLNKENIHIRVTNLTYGGILKEGYLVNLVLGGIISLVGLIFTLYVIFQIRKYLTPNAKQIDEECNRNDSIWLDEYQLYLTNNSIVTTCNGINAIDISTVTDIVLYDTVKNNKTTRVLEAKSTSKTKIPIYESYYNNSSIYEEDIDYLKDIFRDKNIGFKCKVQLDEYDE